MAEFPQKQGSKLTYGPFTEKPAGATEPVSVRFEFNKPVTHVSRLERDVEVSHWGGNVAFEERYVLYHRGANLSSLFNRVKWQQSQYHQPATTWALKEMKFPLRVGSADPYYTDVIGNVSTSRFRSNKREALLEIKPRYPVFGGWKYPFTVGWNSDAKNFLRRTATGGFVLNVPFLEGPRQPEGLEYEQVQVRVILPEGAEYDPLLDSLPGLVTNPPPETSSSTPPSQPSPSRRPTSRSTAPSSTPSAAPPSSSPAATWSTTCATASWSSHTTTRCQPPCASR